MGADKKGLRPGILAEGSYAPHGSPPNGGADREGFVKQFSHFFQRRERKRSRKWESGLALLTVFSLFVHPYESENRKEQRRRARTEGWRLRAIA